MTKNIELLLPAGNLDVLKVAFHYGADAVYIGGKALNLRKKSKNFSLEDMKQGLEFAHNLGKKVYLTMNIIPHNRDITVMYDFLNQIKENNLNFDAIIVGDLSSIEIVKSILPEMEIHISTQTSPTNYMTINLYKKLGAKRVILARELSYEEIKEINEKKDKDIDTEMFIHGAMCIAYSGRCLLSAYMTNRSANAGFCSHSCRWKYYLREEKRENDYYEIQEDDRGTYIMNSKDLCLAPYIDKVIDTGVCSLKIEGRNKGAYYVGVVAKVYRNLIDSYLNNRENFQFDEKILDELKAVSHRRYTTGFFLQKPDNNSQNYDTSAYIRSYRLVGIVNSIDKENGIIRIDVKNKIKQDDEIEFITKNEYIKYKLNYLEKEVFSKEKQQFFIKEVDTINNQNTLLIKDKELAKKLSINDMIRRKNYENEVK